MRIMFTLLNERYNKSIGSQPESLQFLSNHPTFQIREMSSAVVVVSCCRVGFSQVYIFAVAVRF